MYRDNEPTPGWIWQQLKLGSRFLAISGKRRLFFLKKTIELSYWRGKISFRTSPPIEEDLLFTFSINTFEEVFRSIWKLACGTKTYRDFVVARPLRDMKSSFHSLFFLLWNSYQRLICGKSNPVIFARVLSSKGRKIWIKMQSQRDELASQRLVKHYIMLSSNMSVTCGACLFDLLAVGRFI